MSKGNWWIEADEVANPDDAAEEKSGEGRSSG